MILPAQTLLECASNRARMVRKLDLLEFALEFVTEVRKARDNELT